MTKRNVWVRTRLLPWRGNADRVRLHANSLLRGNFTGNSAVFDLYMQFRGENGAAALFWIIAYLQSNDR
jgi:hypothetical protein